MEAVTRWRTTEWFIVPHAGHIGEEYGIALIFERA